MKKKQKIITEISQLTKNIETNYPEMYKFLDESPIIIPSKNHPNIDEYVLQEYLENLKQLLQHHIETHKNNNFKHLLWEK